MDQSKTWALINSGLIRDNHCDLWAVGLVNLAGCILGRPCQTYEQVFKMCKCGGCCIPSLPFSAYFC